PSPPSAPLGPHTGAPPPPAKLSPVEALSAWAPWVLLSAVMIAWSYFKILGVGQIAIPIPQLHNRIFISLYRKPYAAVYLFQPLAVGTGALTATVLTAVLFSVRPATFLRSGFTTLRQLRLPCLTVALIVGLAF